MQTLLNRRSRAAQVAAALFPLVAFAASARADIFQWEYVDPADPSQGKRQSTQRVWDGLGVNAAPGAYLAGRDLTMAYLIGADLTNAKLGSKIESEGRLYINPPLLSSPNVASIRQPYSGPLDYIDFRDARLDNADFTGANVRGASFSRGYCPPDTLCNHYNPGGGITLAQLYSTASYQAHDLRGIDFTGNSLSGGDFAGHDLTNTSFTSAYLTDADFTGADIKGAKFAAIFEGTGLKLAQLYSTATYQTHDLSGIDFGGNDLTDGRFAGINLSSARFSGANLTDTDFTDAVVQGASFDIFRYTIVGITREVGTGITLAQTYIPPPATEPVI